MSTPFIANRPERIQAFGISIDPVDMKQAAQRCIELSHEHNSPTDYVVTPNVDHLVQLSKNTAFQLAYQDASLVTVDGKPVKAALQMFGYRIPEVVTGSDLAPAIFDHSRGGGPELSVFLLGAAPGVAEKAALLISARWPHIEICGFYSPPTGFENSQEENDRMLSIINAADPDILIVGLGAPKQEIWTHSMRHSLSAGLVLCVGATIDFLAGEKRRAPFWMQRASLEWLFRMLSEPRRLLGRYLKDAIIFPRLVFGEWRAQSRVSQNKQ